MSASHPTQFQIADLFESVADAIPDRLALIAGASRLSFAELDRRANRAAHALAQRGIGPGMHVGIQLYNGSPYVELMLAAYKLRAVAINVNYRYGEAELAYLYDNADLRALAFHRSLAGAVAPALARLPGGAPALLCVDDGSGEPLAGLEAEDYEAAQTRASSERDFAARSPDDRYILYTGGTTGMPKGVVWRQEDFLMGAVFPQAFREERLPLRPEDVAAPLPLRPHNVTLISAPLMHGAAQWATLAAWWNGRGVLLYSERRFDPRAIWRAIAAEGVTALQVVGDAMARPLAEALTGEPDLDLSRLRILMSGGAILSEIAIEKLRARIPELRVADGFGASETGWQGARIGRGGEGSPRFRMSRFTSVLDDELRPIPPGSGRRGRVARSGRIPLGYYKDPEKTAQTFPTDAEGRRWVVAGDWATVEADGSVTVLGRGSVCINTGGEKVFPEEVELALRSHPDVLDAVVVGVPDEKFGERIAAIAALRAGAELSLAQLAAHARGQIASYKLPRELHLVPPQQMPRSPSGKPDYAWARRIALAGREPGATSPA